MNFSVFCKLVITYLHEWWVHNLRNCGAPLLWAGAPSQFLVWLYGPATRIPVTRGPCNWYASSRPVVRPKNAKGYRLRARGERSKVKVIRSINADTSCAISSERQGLRIYTNFKLGIGYGWRTTTRISHRRHYLQGQRSRSQGHVISMSRLGPMLYLSYPAGAYRVGRTWRPHFLLLLRDMHCVLPFVCLVQVVGLTQEC